MTILHNVKSFITSDESSPIRSHQSYDSQVHAVCHHSGRYLTWDEANHPIWRRLLTRLLREQHDFPGLRNLDHAFARAAHSSPHQHVIWSQVAVQSLALLIPGPFVLLLLLALWEAQDFVPLIYWYLYLAGLAVCGIASLALTLVAAARYQQREQIYHKQAASQPPAIIDFPVQGEYHIDAREELQINLDNVNRARPEVLAQQGHLTVTLHPTENDWESYEMYRRQYQAHGVGRYLHAGVVALENLSHVVFLDDVVEFGHRLVLRRPVVQTSLNTGQLRPFEIEMAYHIKPTALYPRHNGLERFPLECEPRLSSQDSRTLELRFYWRGQDPTTGCHLEECILNIPDSLAPVTKVTFGRYDHERQQVIWRHRSFRQQNLVLSASFEKPILKCHELIHGIYKFSYDGLLSQMEISPERVWTVLGTQATADSCHITRQTAVAGTLTLGLQRLSQEHEYIQPMPRITCPVPPDERLVQVVLNVLLEEGFDLQRLMRAAPRLAPTGRLDKHLYYWDIVGRRYNEILLDSLDVHVVITGSDKNSVMVVHDEPFQAESNIDLRVRCLHDPRNTSTPEAVDALVGREDEYSLAAKINAAIQRYWERPDQ